MNTGGLVTTPAEWRNFGTRFPIAACRMKPEDMKALYRLIDDRQVLYRDKIVAVQSQQPYETPQGFEERRKKVQNAYVTSVTITMKNGELLTGNNREIFDAVAFWEQVRSVFFSTQSVPQAVLQAVPQDRITLFLDFSQPPALDFSRLPTLSTPNESNFEIAAVDEAWFILSKTRLTEFFQQHRSRYDWIHRSGIYDILLFILGLPLSIWGAVKVGMIVPGINDLNTFLRVLIYAYIFLFSLAIFRCLFSYARWVFSKVEVETERVSPFRHRAVWAIALSSLFWPAIYDAVKFCVSYLVSK
jgi:hypothetical protein